MERCPWKLKGRTNHNMKIAQGWCTAGSQLLSGIRKQVSPWWKYIIFNCVSNTTEIPQHQRFTVDPSWNASSCSHSRFLFPRGTRQTASIYSSSELHHSHLLLPKQKKRSVNDWQLRRDGTLSECSFLILPYWKQGQNTVSTSETALVHLQNNWQKPEVETLDHFCFIYKLNSHLRLEKTVPTNFNQGHFDSSTASTLPF